MALARRGFLGLLGVAVVAPAIIRTPGLLMPIKPPLPLHKGFIIPEYGVGWGEDREAFLRHFAGEVFKAYEAHYPAVQQWQRDTFKRIGAR